MALSSDVLKAFASVTNDNQNSSNESTVYGTIVSNGDDLLLQLDGSSILTPVTMAAGVKSGDRVVGIVKNHSVVVLANATDPASAEDIRGVRNTLLNMTGESGGGVDISAIYDSELGEYWLNISSGLGHDQSHIEIRPGYLNMYGTALRMAFDNYDIELDSAVETYTAFDSSIITSGSIAVAKKFGFCKVWGEFTLSAYVSDWTTILDSTKVPAPQFSKNIYVPSTQWGSSFVREPRIRISGSGGLAIRYGGGTTYNFSDFYMI